MKTAVPEKSVNKRAASKAEIAASQVKREPVIPAPLRLGARDSAEMEPKSAQMTGLGESAREKFSPREKSAIKKITIAMVK